MYDLLSNTIWTIFFEHVISTKNYNKCNQDFKQVIKVKNLLSSSNIIEITISKTSTFYSVLTLIKVLTTDNLVKRFKNLIIKTGQ